MYSGPSRAAADVAGIPAYDGWRAWRVGGSDGELLDELRARLLRRWAELEDEPTYEIEDEAPREPTIELAEDSEGRDGEDSASDALGGATGGVTGAPEVAL